ncbi:hypothetical protein [Silvanigrella sp.]|uniref:hypothetical protein n=1 Tax=Silvanigrella sp. TaxID=2024976 RepID=UPI0037C552A8
MISNFIFHFVFAVFTIWACVAWFIQNNRSSSIRNALVPLLSLNKIEFPKHRSLFIRGVKSLEEELSIKIQTKVKINCKITETISYNPIIFRTFCLFFNSKILDEEKVILFENNYFTLFDLIINIKKRAKVKNLNFILNQTNEKKYYWLAEIDNG